MSKRSDKHYKMESYSNNCYVYICMYGEKRDKLCDFSCICTGKPCQNYVNAYWKIMRWRHYHKTKVEYPTTLVEFRKRVSPLFRKKNIAYGN